MILSWRVTVSRTVRGIHGHVDVKYATGDVVHHELEGDTWQEMMAHAEAIVPSAPVPEVASAG